MKKIKNSTNYVRYAQYYIVDNNKYEELIGSDSILPIDKRLSIGSAIIYVQNHTHSAFMKKVHNNVAFRIFNAINLNSIYHYETNYIKL